MPSPQDKIPIHPTNEKGRFKRAWRESHGNALLGFAAFLFVLGMFLIWTSPPKLEPPVVDMTPEADNNSSLNLPNNSIVIRVVTDQISSEGPIRIAVYDSKESFGNPDRAIIKDSLVPVDGFVIWEIELDFLPESFAIAAYHDLDNNGELNRALFNAPVEPYGFSNNARSLIGPPTYEQTIMKRPTEPTAIEVRVY